jgi:hypothetical protein
LRPRPFGRREAGEEARERAVAVAREPGGNAEGVVLVGRDVELANGFAVLSERKLGS